MKKLVLLITALTVLVVSAVASAATYTATFTFESIGGGHSYDITVDCTTGAYTGTEGAGEPADVATYTKGETVSGTLSDSSNAGHGAYNRTGTGDFPGYNFDYNLTSSDGTNYSGTLTDSNGGTYPVTSVLSNSTKETACAPPPTPSNHGRLNRSRPTVAECCVEYNTLLVIRGACTI